MPRTSKVSLPLKFFQMNSELKIEDFINCNKQIYLSQEVGL